MTQGAIDLDQPEEQLTRTELTLGQIGRQWRFQPRGEAFTEALLGFLRRIDSPDTLKSYSFSVLQFFGWYWDKHGQLVTPDRVSRADAAEFNRWLRTREQRLTRWWLERDPSRRLDLRIYDVVERDPGIQLDDIARALGVFTSERKRSLAQHLACLVKRRTLERRPTVAEYRRMHGGAIVQPPDSVFRYTVPDVDTPAGAERASSISTRLSALSSLWSFMIRSGENAPGSTEPLLRHNIWTDALSQARAQAPSHQEAARQAKKPSLELFLRLLATTFQRTHGPASFEAAKAAFFGRQLPGRKMVAPSFKDLRDRALLLMMVQTGVRAREVKRLRRSNVSGDPPVVTIIGKGGKKRVVGVPPAVLSALKELSAKLRALAVEQARYGGSGRAQRLLEPEAPLFPAVSYWGANAGQRDDGLSRPGIALLLNRRAEAAGIEPGSELFQKAHPHGLRALFITYALETGTPIHRVQATVGHASIATTGRYAEERRPETLIADVFRAPAPPSVARPPEAARAAVRPPPAEAVRAQVEAWRPREEAIAPPEPPSPEPREAEPEPEPEPEPRIVRRMERERIAAEPPQPAPEAEAFAEVWDIDEARRQVQELADDIARYRDDPLSEREEDKLEKCFGIESEPLRNLCVIYQIHWGEKGNRQVLVSTGGGRRAEGLFTANIEAFEDEEQEEEEFEPPEWDPEEAIREIDEEGMERIAELARAGEAELYAEAGTDRLNRIYSGKDSGLSWWTGTQGKLKPAMPVLSPEQIGSCGPQTQSEICAGLAELWRDWFDESPTKAEALVRWVGEALDTSAQFEAERLRRDGRWVDPQAPWPETRFEGTRRKPKPRMVFRQHLPNEVIAWFKARAGSYRVSSGDPTTWQKKTEQPKVIGDPLPEWYEQDDPVRDLPMQERRMLLDWILALSGQMPMDSDKRFQRPDGGLSSRRDIAELLWAVCQFDQTIDGLRDSAEFGPQYTASLFRKKSVDEMPMAARPPLQKAQRQAQQAMWNATDGRVSDFDLYNLIKRRVRGGAAVLEEAKQKREQLTPNAGRRDAWAMRLVRKFFGAEAASDMALKVVAKCGDVPLAGFEDLFRVRGETIVHTPEFKRAFAEQFGAHSECVARRIARKLWEIKQGRDTPKEAVQKPQHMVTLVEVMRTFKVPCSDTQAFELRQLVPWLDEPEGIYEQFAKVHTGAGPQRRELSEAEEQERQIASQYQEAIERALRMETFGEGYESNPSMNLPTPVHLAFALM